MISAHTEARSSSDRIRFFDTYRAILIVLVVVLHSLGGFSAIPGMGASRFRLSLPLYFLEMTLESFLMPALFFIAGYFTLPSLVHGKPSRFIVSKARRLGMPLVIGSIFLVPLSSYLSVLLQSAMMGRAHPGYGVFWLHYMKEILAPRIGPGWTLTGFSHGWLWFLSLLLVFQVSAWVVYHFMRRTFSGNMPIIKAQSEGKNWMVLCIVFIMTAVGYMVVNYQYPGRQFITIWNLILFQPNKVVFYISYFCFGIYGYSQGWFRDSKASPFDLRLWATVAIIPLVVFLALSPKEAAATGNSAGFRTIFAAIQALLCLSLTAVFSAYGSRHWRRAGALARYAAENSYIVYIIHFPLVLLLKYPVLTVMRLPPIAGFCLVSSGALLLSFLLSDVLIRPYPRLSVGLLVLLNVVMAVQ